MTQPINPNESSKLLFKRTVPDESPKESEAVPSRTEEIVPRLNGVSNHNDVEEDRFEPNCFLGLGVNPVALDEKLHRILNGTGDQIDQLYLYLSPTSAAAWQLETALDDYKAGTTLPADVIVSGIDRRVQKTMPGRPSLNIVALGSGEARQEQRIVQALIRQNTVQKINLYLVDASHPMLNTGYIECERVFSPYRHEVKPLAVYQNFMELPQNRRFLRSLSQGNSMNLITFLGFTFANLENEGLFLRNTLSSFPSKTMLLVDILTPYASSDDPEEIKKKDPQFAARRPYADRAERRWAIPFIQHHPKVKTHKDIQFISVLDNQTSYIKGSYTVEIKARVGDDQWTIQRFKRYNLKGLTEAFRNEKWSHVSTFPFYDDNRSLVLLFQKD